MGAVLGQVGQVYRSNHTGRGKIFLIFIHFYNGDGFSWIFVVIQGFLDALQLITTRIRVRRDIKPTYKVVVVLVVKGNRFSMIPFFMTFLALLEAKLHFPEP